LATCKSCGKEEQLALPFIDGVCDDCNRARRSPAESPAPQSPLRRLFTYEVPTEAYKRTPVGGFLFIFTVDGILFGGACACSLLLAFGVRSPAVILPAAFLGAVAGVYLVATVWKLGIVAERAILWTFGLTVGHSIIGALIGGFFGLEIARRWAVEKPWIGAVIGALPLAVLFAYMSHQRLETRFRA
jgi:hypothetical protein